MPWVAAAVSAVATVAGAAASADASRHAANTAADSAKHAGDETARQYDQNREDQAPFMQTGRAGNARLAYLLGLDPSQFGGDPAGPQTGEFGSLTRKFNANDLANDPVYNSGLKFGLDQGTGALNQRAIANGSYDSGATLKALTRFANDYGSTKANESYNRFNTDNTNTYNRLAGVSGAGQTATTFKCTSILLTIP